MKKIILVHGFALLSLFSCQKEEITEVGQSNTITTQRKCGYREALDAKLRNNPGLKEKLELAQKSSQNWSLSKLVQEEELVIPVIVNVVYKNEQENLSLAQIQSQIDALNLDFSATNSDYDTSKNPYKARRSGSFGIRFVLDNVVRYKTKVKAFDMETDLVKSSKTGGISPTSPKNKLNLWICDIKDGVLGYATPPGTPYNEDGVVICYKNFGTTGIVEEPYNLGRTTTHEVGHWMNLDHIWGDKKCGTDYVADTPTHRDANYGEPEYGKRSTCKKKELEMFMNYMDYCDDKMLYMFTKGQKERALSCFYAEDAGRANFVR